MRLVELSFGHGKYRLHLIASQTFLLLALVLTAVSIPVTSAHANTHQCKVLSRQLASLPRGNSANYRKYDKAAKRQAAELNKAKRLRSQANCNFLSGGKCAALRNSIRKMESNYRKLISTRDRFGNAGSNKRVSIQRKIAALRCGSVTKTVKASTKKRSKIITRGSDSLRPTISAPPQLGGYRTMCVRTCDGYYFPVSHASKTSQMSRDQSICNALCPATETRLYVHRNTDQETEDMVSLTGEPYTALSTAFKYRTHAKDPSCTCGAANPRSAGLALPEQAQRLSNLTPAQLQQEAFLKRLPAPTFRPNLFADAETQADEATGLTTETILRFIGPDTGEVQLSSSTRKVRVVGPQFLPDPSTAINLQAPAPTLVQ